jgi:multidrug efflux system outer membrane protein
LNWELDLWGRLRRTTEAARAQLLAQQGVTNALKVSLVAEAANAYFLLCDLDNRLKIANRTLEDRKESTKIINDRFEKGYVAELDKLQAVQQEAFAASLLPNIKRQIIQVENALNVLMARMPQAVTRGQLLFAQSLTPEIPAGLPSQLLERRPDIVAAEQSLKAQFQRIGIAKAAMFPTLSLTGILGFASPQLSSMLNSGFVANGFANGSFLRVCSYNSILCSVILGTPLPESPLPESPILALPYSAVAVVGYHFRESCFQSE